MFTKNRITIYKSEYGRVKLAYKVSRKRIMTDTNSDNLNSTWGIS